MDRWLRLHTSTAWGTVSILGWGTKIPDRLDIYRILPLKAAYAVFSNAHEAFYRIDHILSDTSRLSKFKKIEIISSVFSNHDTMRLEINYRKKL